jgi:hypothetical protein
MGIQPKWQVCKATNQEEGNVCRLSAYVGA